MCRNRWVTIIYKEKDIRVKTGAIMEKYVFVFVMAIILRSQKMQNKVGDRRFGSSGVGPCTQFEASYTTKVK